jgi:very-short-patch-repair endonuclease
MQSGTATARLLRLWATPAELHLWQHLRAHRVAGCGFRRQHPIGPYIVDFVCLEHRLIIEVDGQIHEARIEYDQIRTAYLRRFGYRVLRFPNSQVLHETRAVLRSIKRHLSSRKS